MNGKALLILEIDRVGEFVENSRKTQDAWLGSYLISYIMAAAAVRVEELWPGSVRYPRVADQPLFHKLKNLAWPDGTSDDAKRISGFPDRLMMEVPEQCVNDAVQELTQVARGAWGKVWEGSRTKVADAGFPALAEQSSWESQCEEFFRLHWAAVPVTGKWRSAYADCNQLLASVNRSRPMEHREQPGQKCSLCGNLSALPIGSRHYAAEWRRLHDSRRFGRLFGPNERLSAVYAAKRLAGWATVGDLMEREGAAAFPSLMSIASAKFRGILLDLAATSDISVFRDKLASVQRALGLSENEWREVGLPRHRNMSDGSPEREWLVHLDGEWLYRESYELPRVLSEYGVSNQERRDTLASALPEALESLEKLVAGVRRNRASLPSDATTPPAAWPTAYYAVLAMDGDDMTELMSQPDEWDRVTSALSTFALRVVPRVIHDEHYGQIEYAGGDELIAFIPVGDVLPAMVKLRHLFAGDAPGSIIGRMDGSTCNLADDSGLPGRSMSAGVAIAHSRTAFRLAVIAARDALSRAKSQPGKNRAEVIIMKRSGEPAEAGWRFSEPDDSAGPEVLVSRTCELCKKGWLSRAFLRDLAQDTATMDSMDEACLRADVQRFLIRHFPARDDAHKTSERDEYLELLKAAISNMGLCGVVPLLSLADWLTREG